MLSISRNNGQAAKQSQPGLVSVRPFLTAIRAHHWLKNLLIFTPLITSHKYIHPYLFFHVLIASAAFCLTASAGYLVNDLLDLQADRQHPSKCKRPFASNLLSPMTGKVTAVVFLVTAAFLCLFLPRNFSVILALYLAASLLYSLRLKREPIIDVLMLGGLYTARIIAGCPVISVKPSFWLLAFSMFFFLSLALLKRYTELVELTRRGGEQVQGRGYRASDLGIISAMGLASGYISVLVLAFYVNSREILLLYSHHHAFWILSLLAFYWISRSWLLAHRGQMHTDPLVFAITDQVSLVILFLCIVVILVSV